MKIRISLALLSGCLAFQSAYADIQSQDPRALGMGGATTAAANSAQAHLYNPSLLVNAKKNEDFNFEIYGSGRVADPLNLQDTLADFSNQQYISTFTTSLEAFNTTLTDPAIPITEKISTLPALIDTLTTAAENLQFGIQSLSAKSLTASANAGLMTSVPNGKIGWAVYFNGWADAGAKFNLGAGDNQTITDFIALPDQILTDLENGKTTSPDALLNPVNELDSTVTLDGVIVREFGVALASPYTLNNYTFDVGVTPKYMALQTFGFEQTLQQTEGESGQLDITDTQSYSAFNLDVGLSKQLNEYWKSGLIIKNLVPQRFKTPSKSGSEIKINPAVRVGTSYRYRWATVAADFDLTQNIAPASGVESRYFSVGTELDLWLAKLRLGYRANLAAANNNTTSIGLGLYLLGLNIDAAAAVGQGQSGPNDVNAALQIGLQW